MSSGMDLLLQAVEYSSSSDNDSSSISSAGSLSLYPPSAKKTTSPTSVSTHDSLYSNFLAATKTVISPSLKNNKRPSDMSLPLKKRMKLGGFHAASCNEGSQHSTSTSSSSSMFINKMNESWTTPPPSSLFQLAPHYPIQQQQQQTRHIGSDMSLSTLTRSASGYTDSPTLNSEWTAEATATAAANAAAKRTNNLLLLNNTITTTTTRSSSSPQDLTFNLCNSGMIVTTKTKKSQNQKKKLMVSISNKKKSMSSSSSMSSSASSKSASLPNLVKDLNGNDMCMGYFSKSSSSSSKEGASSSPLSLSIPKVSSMPCSTIITEQPTTPLEGSKNNNYPGQQKQKVYPKEVDAFTAMVPQVCTIATTTAMSKHPSSNIASARSMLYQSYLQALENHKLQ